MALLKKSSDEDGINLKVNSEPNSVKEIVKSTEQIFNNRIPINYNYQKEIFKSLLTYTEGYEVYVNYYKRLGSYINKQTNNVIIPNNYDKIVGTAYDLISNMKIKLEDEISITVDEEQTEYNVVGTGTVYPGIDPHVGDIFLMNINDNQIGIFIIDNVVPLTYHNDSMYRIDFNLYRILTQEFLYYLEQVTVNKYVFNEETYFDSNYALLKEDNYITLENVISTITTISNDIFYENYDKILNTLLRHDTNNLNETVLTYDPLFIEFYNYIIANKEQIQQLLPTAIDRYYKDSVWNRILRFNKTKHFIKNKYEVITMLYPHSFDVTLIALSRKRVVFNIDSVNTLKTDSFITYRFVTDINYTEDSELSNYIFTDDFYNYINNQTYDINNFKNIEKMLKIVLEEDYTTDNINLIKTLLQYPYSNTEDINKLYYLTLVVFILKKFKSYLINN